MRLWDRDGVTGLGGFLAAIVFFGALWSLTDNLYVKIAGSVVLGLALALVGNLIQRRAKP